MTDGKRLACDGARTGLATGTVVLTLDGALPVEHLFAGDRIITRDAGAQTLLALEWVDVAAGQVVAVDPAALGRVWPAGRVVLGAGQAVLLRGRSHRAAVLTPVWRLIDGARIRPAGGTGIVRLYRPILGRPHVIYAGGLELAAATAGNLTEAA